MVTIKEIVEMTKEERINEIVKTLPVGEKKLRVILKDLGCKPPAVGKSGWTYDEENTEIERPLEDFISRTATPKKPNASIVKASKSEEESPIEAIASNEIAVAIEEKSPKSRVKASKSTPKAHESESELDAIDMLLTRKATSKKRTYRGFYFDEDILNVIDGIASGNKSDLVNEVLRKVFKDKGLL